MTKLSEVIAELERDAEEREHRSKHGTPLSSLTDDIAEGVAAEAIRAVVAKLKEVDSL